MNISQEFKDKIKAGKFKEALILALSETRELTVTTSVVNELTGTESDTYITTEINLLEGEIINSLSKDILDNPAYQDLCQIHFEQVNKSQEIIFNNLKSFEKILGFLEGMATEKSQELAGKNPKTLPFEENERHDSD